MDWAGGQNNENQKNQSTRHSNPRQGAWQQDNQTS